MARDILSDEQWELIEPHLPPQNRTGSRPNVGDHRTTLEGILSVARMGAPWRDLPERFGKWTTVYRRFRRWSQRGVFRAVLESLIGDIDLDVAMIDGTYMKAHQHAAGAKKSRLTSAESKRSQAIGRSRGGLTSKVVATCDRDGRIAAITLAAGNRSEAKLADGVLDQVGRVGRLLADKAYDSRTIRSVVAEQGGEPVISSRRSAKRPAPCDMDAYKARHLVENAFADIMQFRGIATRYCKLALTFTELLSLVCFVVNTRRTRRVPSPHTPATITLTTA